MKHPNTEWELVIHEGSPEAVDKPHLHHYGVRVETVEEVNTAYEYLNAHKEQYKLMRVSRPHESHFANRSISANPAATTGKSSITTTRLWCGPAERHQSVERQDAGGAVSRRGYLPQALSHGNP